MKSPTPEEITKSRKYAGLTQTEAAKLVHSGLRAWQGWEAKEGDKGHRAMHPAIYELFLIKVKMKK